MTLIWLIHQQKQQPNKKCPIDTRLNPELLNTVGFSSALNDLAFSKYFAETNKNSASASQPSVNNVQIYQIHCYSCSIVINELVNYYFFL